MIERSRNTTGVRDLVAVDNKFSSNLSLTRYRPKQANQVINSQFAAQEKPPARRLLDAPVIPGTNPSAVFTS
jgi:hypothetical protein